MFSLRNHLQNSTTAAKAYLLQNPQTSG